jgi:hypothetical protein
VYSFSTLEIDEWISMKCDIWRMGKVSVLNPAADSIYRRSLWIKYCCSEIWHGLCIDNSHENRIRKYEERSNSKKKILVMLVALKNMADRNNMYRPP